MEQSAGREGRCATDSKTGTNTGLDWKFSNQDLAGLVQAHDRRHMDPQRRRGVQRDAYRTVLRRRLIQQRMHVANRQHHRQQHQEDAGGNSGPARSGWWPCMHHCFRVLRMRSKKTNICRNYNQRFICHMKPPLIRPLDANGIVDDPRQAKIRLISVRQDL